ncbi:SUKH-4 family immunity protein [Streptomyces sp. NPDC007100]|uniref:SUKH-4 family immunity protein n=1 Tax=Streptomyces sp. NPDC007100 TaxID=3155602 RepID=UPI0033D3DDE0
MNAEEVDGLLDDPVRLLGADRAAVRAHIAAGDGTDSVGREVFQQAEALFGGQEVPRAEFASWLHFAAKVLGHDAYAEQVAAAEPEMPWRAIWAWWRPVGQCMAHPNLSGSDEVLLHVHNGREVLGVQGPWENTWLDLETGQPISAPAKDTTEPTDRSQLRDESVEYLDAWQLHAPHSWGTATPIPAEDGRTRYLVEDAHGLALLATDPAVLRDWPRGQMNHASAEDGSPGKAAPLATSAEEPLTAPRIDEAFAPYAMQRIPASDLPAALEHGPSRAHLTDIGLPTWWSCGSITFEPRPAEEMTALSHGALQGIRLPEGLQAVDLLALGTCESGDIYLHRREGTVHICASADDLSTPDDVMVELAPDLDLFTRCLEAVRRYMNACWYPYPDEPDMGQMLLMEMDDLAPDLFDPDTHSGAIWEHLFAGVTELGPHGY